jgi:Flp pilus assembly protein TadB
MMPHETDASIGGLVRGALGDVRELIREEVALARAELRQEMTKASSAAIKFSIAAAALLFAGVCLLVAISLGLAALLDWPAWAGFAVVAGALGAVSAFAFNGGRRAVRTVQPLPRTMHTMKENFR